MIATNNESYTAIENHFQLLDALTPSEENIISSEKDKSTYETHLMYVYRKYQAAEYHCENIKGYLVQDRKFHEAIVSNERSISSLIPGARRQSRVSWSADYYVYELSAFLEAIKSSLDFLALVSAKYLPGITTDSIRTFIRGAQRGRDDPITSLIAERLEWFVNIREYRHHLVHRMIINAHSSHEVREAGGKTQKISYPVIIPESTPTFVPDTRESRMSDDEIKGFDIAETHIRITNENGSDEIIEHRIEITPAAGYVSIEEFANYHLEQYEEFFIELIEVLNALDFRLYTASAS